MNPDLVARVIPCLDVTNGRVVKGINFVDLRDAGDPVELAARYDAQGADELVFLDITASSDGRDTMIDVVSRTAEEVFIQFTVAVQRPQVIADIADEFGSQCVVCAIDAKWDAATHQWMVFLHGGRTATELNAVEWAVAAVSLGAGEILLTSMDRDGTRDGFDLGLTRAVSDAVGVPVIASGGVGTLSHLSEGVTEGGATGVLAASIFHFGEHTIGDAKRDMAARGVRVRNS